MLQETTIAHIRAIDPALEAYLPHYLHLLSLPTEGYPLPAHLSGEALRLALEVALVTLFTSSAQQNQYC